MDSIQKFVISISESRLRSFNKHLDSLGWTAEVVPGVRGRYGCSLSHLKCWKRIASLPPGTLVIIFEDDAHVCKPLGHLENEAFKRFDSGDTGVLLLGHNPIIVRGERLSGILFEGHALDTHAYVIKQSFASYLVCRYESKMLQSSHHAILPVGVVDTLWLIEKVSFLSPMLFIQDNNYKYNGVCSRKTPRCILPLFLIFRYVNLVWWKNEVSTIVLVALLFLVLVFAVVGIVCIQKIKV